MNECFQLGGKTKLSTVNQHAKLNTIGEQAWKGYDYLQYQWTQMVLIRQLINITWMNGCQMMLYSIYYATSFTDQYTTLNFFLNFSKMI